MDSSGRGSVGPRGPPSERCVVLVGSIGCGKTLTANTLLGPSPTPGASPRAAQVRSGVCEGRRLTVLETPRWYWRGQELEADIQQETVRCLRSAGPGPFIFLILIPVGEFTEMERRIPEQLQHMFGPSVLEHTLVLLTCGEFLMGRGLEAYLQQEKGLQELVRRCGGRCALICNRRPEDPLQVHTLMEKVDETLKRSGGYQRTTDEEQRPAGGAAHLTHTHLSDKHLTDKRLTDTHLTDTHLANTHQSDKHLTDTHLSDTNLSDKQLSSTHLANTHLSNKHVSSTHLANTHLSNKHVSNTHLTNTHLQDTNLSNTQLSKTQLPDTHLSHTQMHLSNKQLPNTHLSDTHLQDWVDAEMMESRRVNGLQSEHTHETHTPLDRSYKLSREGAVLSQMMEEPLKPPEPRRRSFINSIHHSIKRTSSESDSPPPSSPSTGPRSAAPPSSPSTGPRSAAPPSAGFPSSSSSSPSSSLLQASPPPELRLLLLGCRGSGKSSAGNLILGREEFSTAPGSAQRCVKAGAVLGDTRVSVVDTPDCLFSGSSPEELTAQICSCVSLLAPGPHALLLCVPVDRPADGELQALEALESVLGAAAVRRHTLVLFTHSDLLPGGAGARVEQVEEVISARRPQMMELVQRCGDRYHIQQRSRGPGARRSVTELMEKVEQMLKEGGGGFYDCSHITDPGDAAQQTQLLETPLLKGPTPLPETPRHGAQLRAPGLPLETLQEVKEERVVTAVPLGSVWQRARTAAGSVPQLLLAGALAGAVLGIWASGAVGGAVGAALGSALTHFTTQTLSKHKTH
ncbi:uncharacterized protein isoform X2 [Danio rerio]|uniref:Uncharacterized protein isoform X2 n=1 Tax=Danio rerio TaxID=7955 RepID=A0AC58JSU5_DANRE